MSAYSYFVDVIVQKCHVNMFSVGLEKTEPSAEQTSTPDVVEKDVSDGLNVPSTDASSGSDWYTGDSQKQQ